MSRRQYDTRSQAAPRDPSGRRRSGTWLGPVRITPVRVTLAVALAGGVGFLLWAVLVRDQLQVPLMATGFAICGLVFAATAVLSVAAVVRAGREGRDGTAVLTALLGGVVAIVALMSFAAAVIMSLIWGATPGA
jgi:nitrate reductase NapE component